MVRLLKGPSSSLGRDEIYWHYPHDHAGGFSLPGESNNGPYSAVRSRNWKLIEYFEDNRAEPYDLANDMGETNDMASRQRDKVAQLRRQLQDWRASVKAQTPTFNANYDPQKAEPRR